MTLVKGREEERGGDFEQYPVRMREWIKKAKRRKHLEDIDKVYMDIPSEVRNIGFVKVYSELWEFVKEGSELINEGIDKKYGYTLKASNLFKWWSKLYIICLKVKNEYMNDWAEMVDYLDTLKEVVEKAQQYRIDMQRKRKEFRMLEKKYKDFIG